MSCHCNSPMTLPLAYPYPLPNPFPLPTAKPEELLFHMLLYDKHSLQQVIRKNLFILAIPYQRAVTSLRPSTDTLLIIAFCNIWYMSYILKKHLSHQLLYPTECSPRFLPGSLFSSQSPLCSGKLALFICNSNLPSVSFCFIFLQSVYHVLIQHHW